MDNVVVSGTKGGGALKKEAGDSQLKRREEEPKEENGEVKWREGEVCFTTACGCQGQLKWL